MTDQPEVTKEAKNTDRELWREADDYYAPSLFITDGGGIGMNVGGRVVVKPIREWHALATNPEEQQGNAALCQCPNCGRMHRSLGFGAPPNRQSLLRPATTAPKVDIHDAAAMREAADFHASLLEPKTIPEPSPTPDAREDEIRSLGFDQGREAEAISRQLSYENEAPLSDVDGLIAEARVFLKEDEEGARLVADETHDVHETLGKLTATLTAQRELISKISEERDALKTALLRACDELVERDPPGALAKAQTEASRLREENERLRDHIRTRLKQASAALKEAKEG